MNRLAITDLPLKGLKLVERGHLGDERGFLSRLFCTKELAAARWVKPIAQVNHTFSAERGTVRGLHFQHPPFCEMKLITCLKGSIWDVAVDLRADSPTFLQWHAQVLSEDNAHSMLIPEGFAHGFQTLTENVELIYFHSAEFEPSAEGGLSPQDSTLNINWPLRVSNLSRRDSEHPALVKAFKGICV